MTLKNIFCLLFATVSCSSVSEKPSSSQSTYVNGTKIECPTPGTMVDCMPRIDAELRVYCNVKVREWVMKNCKNVQYTD